MKKLLILLFVLIPVISFAQVAPPTNGNVALPSNGATARVQMPSLTAGACSFVADSANTGNIYYGGPTVTNSSGVNKGFPLAPGGGIFDVSVTNLSAVFFSTDTNNNVVQWTCN